MNDDTMLPEDDRDRALARRIGARLDEGAPLDDAGATAPDDAAFYRALVAFKHETPDAAPPAEVSQRAWATLEGRLAGAGPDRPALRLLRGASPAARAARLGLALAASLLVLAALGWLLLWRPAPPVLLAAADADVATYTAPDGSVVRLRPHSQLYALDDAGTRVRLVGEGFFDVTENEARAFSVEAGDAVISVLGTRFDVSTWGGQTVVYLEEGRVRFAHRASQQAVVLAPGQRSALTPEGTLLQPAADAPGDYLDWLRRELTFTRRPLRRVLAELEHHYGLTLDVPDALQAETVTGRILLDGPAQSLHDLAVILNGRFVPIDEKTYRFVPQ